MRALREQMTTKSGIIHRKTLLYRIFHPQSRRLPQRDLDRSFGCRSERRRVYPWMSTAIRCREPRVKRWFCSLRAWRPGSILQARHGHQRWRCHRPSRASPEPAMHVETGLWTANPGEAIRQVVGGWSGSSRPQVGPRSAHLQRRRYRKYQGGEAICYQSLSRGTSGCGGIGESKSKRAILARSPRSLSPGLCSLVRSGPGRRQGATPPHPWPRPC